MDTRLALPPASMAAAPALTTPIPLPADLPAGTKLHIGGKVRVPGWTVLNIAPGPHVDILGDCSDLSAVADQSCAIVYASHVIEHLGYDTALLRALKEFNRVLAPGGQVMIAVPDMDILCRLFTRPDLSFVERFQVMKMMFGGRVDAYDFHLVGLNAEFLANYLAAAGFVELERVREFGHFPDDCSANTFKGHSVSLNVIGRKAARAR
ncbi:MAG TPA: methyltransferase domain-containing protein [Alphaproteobacteria bacterium]|nr:methyltransferase domain-containing protein [Alphaproteobacteria bacterium]